MFSKIMHISPQQFTSYFVVMKDKCNHLLCRNPLSDLNKYKYFLYGTKLNISDTKVWYDTVTTWFWLWVNYVSHTNKINTYFTIYMIKVLYSTHFEIFVFIPDSSEQPWIIHITL